MHVARDLSENCGGSILRFFLKRGEDAAHIVLCERNFVAFRKGNAAEENELIFRILRAERSDELSLFHLYRHAAHSHVIGKRFALRLDMHDEVGHFISDDQSHGDVERINPV